MNALFDVVLPVFIVIGAGYLAVWRKVFTAEGADLMMRFAQKFAIPCLLFTAVSRLDLHQDFDWWLLLTYYSGSIVSFSAGMLGARHLFGRPWTDSVAIGFVALFPNSVLLGLPITERAYGAEALTGNFAIISIHAAFCYLIGITVMETVSARSAAIGQVVVSVLKAMFRNTLMIGVALGFAVNLSGLQIPAVMTEAIDLMTRAALPVALFSLGGVLVKYRPAGDGKVIIFACCLSLFLHPAWVLGLGSWGTGLSVAQVRSAVLTAAMAPGVNAYLFADMYGAARRVAASSVLLGTAATVLTGTLWLMVLP